MLTLQHLHGRIEELQSHYDQALGALKSLETRLEQTSLAMAEAQEQIGLLEQVQLLFAKTSEYARAQVKRHVEATVTAALQAVFGRDMRFEVVLREIGGNPAAEWRVVDAMGDTEVAGEPEESRGGGVSDVVSLALRLAVLELVRPKPGGPILLDEPGKHVSAEHREAFGEFLKAYGQRVGRQIIMVTHHEELAAIADVAYRVERENGISGVVGL